MLLLLWGLALAVFDRGEAHRARLVESPGRGEGLIQLQYAFMEWYRERKDKVSYQNEPYPVYLIAAEAGGLYAAQFTAKVLARLQDRCPNFAQHVFAISGVSGGSLGASIFSSLAKKHAKNGPWQPCRVGSDVFEKKVDEILKQDFLAPIVSRAFFADLLQRFLPQPLIVSQFSRGRAFEESIVHAWNRVEGKEGNPFASPVLSHWRFDDAGPALLLNTTSVSDGRQMVASPFGPDIDDPGYHIGYLFMQEALSGKDLTLGSAVGLSGRFPWILPAATVGDNRLALVDGAYFEGSGVETLSVIRNALRPYEVKPAGEASFPYITVHVMVIGGAPPGQLHTDHHGRADTAAAHHAKYARPPRLCCPQHHARLEPDGRLPARQARDGPDGKCGRRRECRPRAMSVEAAAVRPLELRLFQAAARLGAVRRHAKNNRPAQPRTVRGTDRIGRFGRTGKRRSTRTSSAPAPS
jgi:hypothetical protein